MKTKLLAVLALSCLPAVPALAASSQFGLDCRGVQEKKTGMKSAEWSERYRIDLDAKRWCRGACRTGAAIDQITADQIMLRDSRATVGGPADVVTTISRIDGKVSEYVEMGWSGSTFELANGKCTKGAYAGIPGNRF